MKRRLLFAERLLHGDGQSPFNVVFPVQLRGSFTVQSLQHALQRLQQKHPLLSALVEDDATGTPWFVVKENANQIPIEIIERLDDEHWQKITVKEWSTVFNTRIGPMIKLIWLKGEDLSELIMVFHHCFCDGEGSICIFTELLQLLDDATANISEPYPLLTMQDIIPPAILNSKTKIIRSKIIGGLVNMVIKMVPVKKRTINRGTDYLIHWKLEKEVSDKLINKCKTAGVTVNTALCVAVLQAFKAVRKEKFHNKISCPVNIRRFAPQIKKDQLFAFGLLLVTSIDEKLDFFADAKRMQAIIHKKTAKLDPYATMMMMEKAHPSSNKFTEVLKYGKSSNDCMFSNLGKINIPNQYKSFTVENIYSLSVIGPLGNTTTLLTSTYNGLMDFSFIGSENYLPYADALAIKHQMINILTTQAN